MTVRLSRDGGKTWPLAGVLHAGPSAYSSLVGLSSDPAACLFEKGAKKEGYREIRFDSFEISGLKPIAPTTLPSK